MKVASFRVVYISTLFLILALLGCSQTNSDTNARVVADLSSTQSAVDVKQEDNQAVSVGKSIADMDSRLTDLVLPSLRNVQTLYAQHASYVQVEDTGRVVKVMSDDNKGARHQRFLVKVASGQTLLFAHNIDLAGRIENIKTGDNVEFRGEYIWNEKGGIVHWTHRDPQGHHYDGWIKHNGNTYQ